MLKQSIKSFYLCLLLFILLAPSFSLLKAQMVVNLPTTPRTSSEVPEGKIHIDEYGHVSLVHQPLITIYSPKTKDHNVAVLICPGGGYSIVAERHEGVQVAKWLAENGITAAVLRYRLPYGESKIPISDAVNAMKYLRKISKQEDFNKIGIMGFSAGGHLAATIATHSRQKAHPDFQILFYPVISMKSVLTHSGSKRNLLGLTPSDSLVNIYSNETQVTKNTPPAFILCSDDDKAVNPLNSILYYEALKRKHVKASLHIYPLGGHGWGFNDNFTYKKNWTAELLNWIDLINT